uniref:Jacalin-type lectin domain-containing protein n=2 Tax=Quercus lobata TaxID=97700 RepID=A0A7N2M424_QUELO
MKKNTELLLHLFSFIKAKGDVILCSNATKKNTGCNMEECLKVGPWGGKGGNQWSFKANKGGITEIIIFHGGAIDSISLKCGDQDGVLQNSNKIGGNGGHRNDKILLDWPQEYLTSISGTVAVYSNYTVIHSLRFYTNKTEYGPYGSEKGTPFSLPMEGGVIVGFHGRAGHYVDAIGVYVKTMQRELENKMKAVVPRGPGPWGGHGGKEWDDGVFSGIRELHLHVGDSVIHAIRVLYESRDGKPVWSHKHGGAGGDKINTIKFDISTEFLVGVVGFSGPVKGTDNFEALRSITFYTNNGRYGPYGDEIGHAFTSSVAAGKVVGFHGRSGVYLDAIGVHMEYF